MLRKFDKQGKFKVPTYWLVSKLFPNTEIYDCWLEDYEGYMLTHVRTTKYEEEQQLDDVMKKYYGEGYTEVVRVYSSVNGTQLYPKN
jgi:hypothetical protein